MVLENTKRLEGIFSTDDSRNLSGYISINPQSDREMRK
jgi:hypothetical protein